MAKPQQKKAATVRNPTIEAVVKGLLRLPNEESALDKLENLRDHFVISKQQIEDSKTPSLVMWIKGFEVSKEELKKGYLGHFAAIAPRMLEDKKFTLTATKINIELAKHPQRKYQAKKQRHPNWGHPVLRKIKKGVKDVSMEEAVALLVKLHEEYPDASIPGDLKLYLMIYQKPNKGEKPIKKYVFEIERNLKDEDLCNIIYYENTYNKAEPEPPKTDQEILGRFTAKAVMKKNANNQENRMTEAPQINESSPSHFAMYRGAIALAWVDHELDPEEQERLVTYIDHSNELSDAQKAQLREDVKQHIKLEDVWGDITDVQDRAHLLNIADAIFWEDGELCHTEREVMAKIHEKHMATLDEEFIKEDIANYRQQLASNREAFGQKLQQLKEGNRGPLQRMLAYLGVFN